MQTISFLHCALLLVVYSGVVSVALCLHLIRKEALAVPIMGLFMFFLLDNLIIFMTEQLPGFAGWYNQTFLQSPAIKSVIYLGVAYFSISAWNAFMKKKLSSLQIVSIILLGLWLFFIPLMGGGSLESWLYYQGYQIFSIVAASYCLLRLRKTGLQGDAGAFRWIRALLITVIVMSLMITAEDTYVIFRVDNYNSEPYIYNRNVSEDIFRLILVGFIIVRLRSRFRQTPAVPAPVADGLGSPEILSHTDYKRLKYSQHLGLTRREEDILLLLLDDMNNQQISEALHISLGTVKAHVHNVFQKADAANRSELLRQFEIFSMSLSSSPIQSI